MPTRTEHAAKMGDRSVRRVVFTAEEIRRRVEVMGREITDAYGPDEDLLVLGILKGSFIFLADLVRHIHLPLQVDFLVASSYGAGTVTSGEVQLLYDPAATLDGRAVLIVEDIVDSGTTLDRVVPMLKARGPKSLDVCALLHKRLTVLDPVARWVGFEAPREFLVGYGLDYGEHYRHLPYIASI